MYLGGFLIIHQTIISRKGIEMKSIKNKIIIILCTVTILSVVLTSFTLYNVSSKQITKESLNKAKLLSNKYAQEIDRWFEYQLNAVDEITFTLDHMRDFNYEYLCNYFVKKNKTNEDIMGYYIALPDKTVATGTGWIPDDDYDPTTRPWYQDAENSNECIISKPYIDLKKQTMIFTVSKSIKKDNKTIGVVASDVDSKVASNIIFNKKPIKNSYAFLIDNENDILMHPKKEFNPEGESDFKNLNKILDGRLNKISKSKNGITLEKDFDGKEKYFIVSPIESSSWKLCLVVPKKEITAPLNKIIFQTLTIIIITIIASIIISLFVGNSISKPIIEATDHIEEIANLNIKKDVPKEKLDRKDEIGRMFYAFQNIIDSLREFIGQISDSSDKVAISAEELAITSEQSTLASENIAEASTKVSTHSDLQLEEILNVTSAMQQISASIQEISSNAEEINSLTYETSSKSNLGKDKIEKVIVQMDNISYTTKELQNSLDEINNSSNKISEFLNVIQGIAEQTNLLALNAAIEAARAGESGRGFAVVAEEVRKLAEGVQDAAEKISQLIQENHVVLKKTNSVVENNTKNVENGIKVVNDSSEAFVEITNLVNKVNEQIEVITNSINEVAKGSGNVASSTSEMESMSQKVSEEIQNISASTEEQTASMEELSSASQNLAQVADELKNFIDTVEY